MTAWPAIAVTVNSLTGEVPTDIEGSIRITKSEELLLLVLRVLGWLFLPLLVSVIVEEHRSQENAAKRRRAAVGRSFPAQVEAGISLGGPTVPDEVSGNLASHMLGLMRNRMELPIEQYAGMLRRCGYEYPLDILLKYESGHRYPPGEYFFHIEGVFDQEHEDIVSLVDSLDALGIIDSWSTYYRVRRNHIGSHEASTARGSRPK